MKCEDADVCERVIGKKENLWILMIFFFSCTLLT